MGNSSAKPASPSASASASARTAASASPSASARPSSSPPPSPRTHAPPFRQLSADQRAITFDERVHLRPSADRVTLATTQPMSGFRPLQRAATFDPRLRSQRGLLTVSDVLYRRYFNAQERRASVGSLFRIAEAPEDEGPAARDAVVVVDPFSTGRTLAESVLARGLACVCVWSDTLEVMDELIKHVPADVADRFAAVIFHNGSDAAADADHALYETLRAIAQVPHVRVIGVVAGAETGVLLADKLSEHLGLTTNGSAGSAARRNKFLMGEKVRAAGLRAVRQRSATKWAHMEEFVAREQALLQSAGLPMRVIVKPVESAGSDDVALCTNIDEVRRAFGNIQGKINGLGLENTATLVQEYLEGTEYVVDTVSRDGKHKCVAVWEYDKRRVNDAPFVYFGVILRAVDETLAPMVDYVLKVLDALEIRHGPAHAEVKLVRKPSGEGLEPCLVEIGARCHGGEGSYLPIVNRCLGYNHVDAALDSYFDADAFEALPDRPMELKAFGCEAMLVSYVDGTLTGYPGLPEIEQMASFVSKMIHLHEGDAIAKTIDMFSTPGSALLVHDDREQLESDYKRIRELEIEGLYAYTPLPADSVPTAAATRVAVVVDPFSTGAVLAHELISRGLECICVYSDKLENIENVASLIPDGLTLTFAATIAYEGDLQATVAAIKKACAEVAGGREDAVCAVFPGAELGVKLSDSLGDALGLPGNVLAHSNARRDKYLMGETLRAAGVRAVKQVKATTWAEAEAFILHDLKPEPFEVVLKPLESAGTEDVVLCLSIEEAQRTFRSILGKVNGLGIENQAVLLQEYLEGDEYVVDTVSRNGEHKAVAIWKYDKRRVNDAAFVYFGLSLVPADDESPIIHALIDYQFKVLDALGVRSGPAHGEVKFCRGAPVLIEVGARCHGGEGAWVPIADRCVGYNQVGAAIDSVLDADAFAALPDRPRVLKQYGCEAMLVSYRDGVLKSSPGLEEIDRMPAFLKREIFVAPGDVLRRTIDMFTTPGSIMLTHPDRSVLEQNLARIRELELDGLFELE